MRFHGKIVLFCIILSFHWQRMNAQVPFFKLFQVDKEHSELRVQCIIKDNTGFIWLGTSEGLYKFNGIEFEKIPSDLIKDSSVTALFEDRHQQLWIGFKSGRIATMTNNHLKLFNPGGDLPSSSIHSIIEDHESRIWFATNGEGVFYYDHSKMHNIGIQEGLNDNYAYSLATLKNGTIWIGTDQGISICRLTETGLEISKLTSANGLPDNIVSALLPDSDGAIWIGMQDKGVCKYMPETKSFFIPEPLQNWSWGEVNCLMKTEDQLWIGTTKNGIINYDTQQENPVRHLTGGEHLKLSKVVDLLEDTEFNVWIVNNNQLIRSSGEKISFLSHVDSQFRGEKNEEKKTIRIKFIHSILVDHNENIWFTPDQGLIKLNMNEFKGKRLTKFTITDPKLLVDITSLYEDRYGFLWIGTMGKGIFRLNTRTGTFIKMKGNPELENASILSINGTDDVLWVAGLEGVLKCTIVNGESEHARLQISDLADTKNVSRNYIYCIFIDSKKRVWLGTDDQGIIVYDHGKFTTYSSHDGLKSNVVYSITEDLSGHIWFSTLKGGIYQFDGKIFRNYSTAEGLSDLSVFSIAADQFGNIIIVNKNGIDVLDPVSGAFNYFDRAEGIPEINSDLNAISKDNRGNFWIGSESAIIKYHPNGKKKKHQPKTILSQVSIFLEAVDFSSVKKFSYDQNNFTFDFIGLWYSDPDRIQYQYMLEGYNNNWISTRDRSIAYPRLPFGRYTFKIRSSINQDFSDAQIVEYAFVITPPFWFRWWFLVITSLVIGFGFRNYIINRERRIKHMDRLQKEKIIFQFETLKSQVNPHFLFNSFNTLISIIEDSPKIAVDYVEHLSQFFRNIIMYREKDVILLKEELELLDNYFFLQKKRFCDHLSLDIQLPEELINTRYVPPLTLQLLLENAVKHNAVSKETPLHVEIFINKHGKLVVRNNRNIKMKKLESPGIGLQNIVSRFQLLSDRNVEIKDGAEFFEVSIPLMKEE